MSVPLFSGFARRLDSLLWEAYLGVDTRRPVFGAPTEGGCHYSPLPYIVVRRMMQHLKPTSSDVLVDIGSGKGRVICVASRYPMRRVVGIEVSHDLVNVSRSNIQRVRLRKAEVEVLEVPGQDYPYEDTTLVVMYNPFDEATMESVFKRLSESYGRNPRLIKVAYANCAWEGPLHRTGWLRKVGQWDPLAVSAFPHPTSFWESRLT